MRSRVYKLWIQELIRSEEGQLQHLVDEIVSSLRTLCACLTSKCAHVRLFPSDVNE